MKKNKFSEESKEVLSLGSLHVKIQKEKAHAKIKIIPIILIFCGIVLILIGIFFTDIKVLINKFVGQQSTSKVVENKDNSITVLTCEYKKDDTTLGLNKKKNIKYEFKDNLLKKITVTMTMTIIENSYDIGINNINIYYQRYNNALKDIKLNGLDISTTYKNETLKNIISIDYEIVDINSIPKNDYINITNTKDQSYRVIKELEGKAGHICKITYK